MLEPIDLKSTIEPQECVLLEDGTHATVDIPIDVIATMAVEILQRDLLCPTKTEAIFEAAAYSLNRRDATRTRPVH
jgi:hypothetical protein